MGTSFKLHNNSARTLGFAGRLCIAGSGCTTPAKAAETVINGQPFRLPPAFEMHEDELFKSYRGVIASMKTPTPGGKSEIEVFIDGVPMALTVADIMEWAGDYRSRKGIAEPQDRDEHTKELERSMNRPEDPIERQARLTKAEDRDNLVRSVAQVVLQVLEARNAPPAPAPAAPPAPVQGRNDEKPEPLAPPAQEASQGRARPRP